MDMDPEHLSLETLGDLSPHEVTQNCFPPEEWAQFSLNKKLRLEDLYDTYLKSSSFRELYTLKEFLLLASTSEKQFPLMTGSPTTDSNNSPPIIHGESNIQNNLEIPNITSHSSPEIDSLPKRLTLEELWDASDEEHKKERAARQASISVEKKPKPKKKVVKKCLKKKTRKTVKKKGQSKPSNKGSKSNLKETQSKDGKSGPRRRFNPPPPPPCFYMNQLPPDNKLHYPLSTPKDRMRMPWDSSDSSPLYSESPNFNLTTSKRKGYVSANTTTTATASSYMPPIANLPGPTLKYKPRSPLAPLDLRIKPFTSSGSYATRIRIPFIRPPPPLSPFGKCGCNLMSNTYSSSDSSFATYLRSFEDSIGRPRATSQVDDDENKEIDKLEENKVAVKSDANKVAENIDETVLGSSILPPYELGFYVPIEKLSDTVPTSKISPMIKSNSNATSNLLKERTIQPKEVQKRYGSTSIFGNLKPVSSVPLSKFNVKSKSAIPISKPLKIGTNGSKRVITSLGSVKIEDTNIPNNDAILANAIEKEKTNIASTLLPTTGALPKSLKRPVPEKAADKKTGDHAHVREIAELATTSSKKLASTSDLIERNIDVLVIDESKEEPCTKPIINTDAPIICQELSKTSVPTKFGDKVLSVTPSIEPLYIDTSIIPKRGRPRRILQPILPKPQIVSSQPAPTTVRSNSKQLKPVIKQIIKPVIKSVIKSVNKTIIKPVHDNTGTFQNQQNIPPSKPKNTMVAGNPSRSNISSTIPYSIIPHKKLWDASEKKSSIFTLGVCRPDPKYDNKLVKISYNPPTSKTELPADVKLPSSSESFDIESNQEKHVHQMPLVKTFDRLKPLVVKPMKSELQSNKLNIQAPQNIKPGLTPSQTTTLANTCKTTITRILITNSESSLKQPTVPYVNLPQNQVYLLQQKQDKTVSSLPTPSAKAALRSQPIRTYTGPAKREKKVIGSDTLGKNNAPVPEIITIEYPLNVNQDQIEALSNVEMIDSSLVVSAKRTYIPILKTIDPTVPTKRPKAVVYEQEPQISKPIKRALSTEKKEILPGIKNVSSKIEEVKIRAAPVQNFPLVGSSTYNNPSSMRLPPLVPIRRLEKGLVVSSVPKPGATVVTTVSNTVGLTRIRPVLSMVSKLQNIGSQLHFSSSNCNTVTVSASTQGSVTITQATPFTPTKVVETTNITSSSDIMTLVKSSINVSSTLCDATIIESDQTNRVTIISTGMCQVLKYDAQSGTKEEFYTTKKMLAAEVMSTDSKSGACLMSTGVASPPLSASGFVMSTLPEVMPTDSNSGSTVTMASLPSGDEPMELDSDLAEEGFNDTGK